MQTHRDTDANWSEIPAEGETTPKRVRHRVTASSHTRKVGFSISQRLRAGGPPSNGHRFDSREYSNV
jgi:hypothetical protein